MRAGITILCLAFLLYFFFERRPSEYPPGILVHQEPDQYPTIERTWTRNGFQITSLASFRIEALVLSAERYWADPGSAISPLDLALGWGPMSDVSVTRGLRFSQGGRWFRYYPAKDVPLEMIAEHSANMHMIPAGAEVESRLKSLRPGDVARIRGYLVQATGPNGAKWRSSLTRADRGAGSCELVWAEEVSRVPPR